MWMITNYNCYINNKFKISNNYQNNTIYQTRINQQHKIRIKTMSTQENNISYLNNTTKTDNNSLTIISDFHMSKLSEYGNNFREIRVNMITNSYNKISSLKWTDFQETFIPLFNFYMICLIKFFIM